MATAPAAPPIDFAGIRRPRPGVRERLLKLAWLCSGRSPGVDALLTRKLPGLKHLPARNPADCIPDFAATEMVIRRCPVGIWSTPLIDVVVLLKCALGFRSRRILEIGSYLGHTARMLAENTDAETRITTLDEFPGHGAAYRGTPVAQKIDRRIGKVSLEHFQPDEKYDLIFVDADHRFESVVNDTRVAMSLLAENGVLVWHDYQQENHFHGLNGVPEALKIFSRSIPIISLEGTYLAVHSRFPGWETARFADRKMPPAPADPWGNQSLRG
ncbi:MAG: class I SAM-dependent methyltransferase [Verrucomicrobia bacterium]|nr:class I SAM-dependent methyltransferase [Verrucomicrobiota bacterium]